MPLAACPPLTTKRNNVAAVSRRDARQPAHGDQVQARGSAVSGMRDAMCARVHACGNDGGLGTCTWERQRAAVRGGGRDTCRCRGQAQDR